MSTTKPPKTQHGINIIIAEIAGVTPDYVSQVRMGVRNNEYIRQLIREVPEELGKMIEKLSMANAV